MARYRDRYWDPTGARYGLPTYPWGMAPADLATRDQLVARGLRPRGEVVAQVMWRTRRGERTAHLYSVPAATPPRPRTAGQVASLAAAHLARRTCPECGRTRTYYLSTTYRACADCIGLAA